MLGLVGVVQKHIRRLIENMGCGQRFRRCGIDYNWVEDTVREVVCQGRVQATTKNILVRERTARSDSSDEVDRKHPTEIG